MDDLEEEVRRIFEKYDINGDGAQTAMRGAPCCRSPLPSATRRSSQTFDSCPIWSPIWAAAHAPCGRCSPGFPLFLWVGGCCAVASCVQPGQLPLPHVELFLVTDWILKAPLPHLLLLALLATLELAELGLLVESLGLLPKPLLPHERHEVR